jgi:hypothetical protein
MRAARVSRLLALLACAGAWASAAAPLGTLFHTPQERERLDRLRRGEIVAAPEAVGSAEPARKREITGYVKRSDGRGTAFIDGIPVPVDPKGAPLLQPDKVPAYAGRASGELKIERKETR